MDTLKATLIKTMQGYSGRGLNGYSYFASNDDENVYTVTSIGKVGEKRIVNTSLLVRLDGAKIIVEEDINNKPLVDALVQNGIPREQIILAYAGEAIPEAG